MLNERKILMGDDGVFTASVGDDRYSLMFDTQNAFGRWLLALHAGENSNIHFLSSHSSLDAGLKEISTHAGWGSKRFSVQLLERERFQRPGKVPAEEIMAAYDFVLAGDITAFGILDGHADLSIEEARSLVEARLSDRAVELGSVEQIPDDEAGWIFDLSIRFDGYIHQDDMRPLMEEHLEGLGFEITHAIEGVLTESKPNAAAIINAFDEAA